MIKRIQTVYQTLGFGVKPLYNTRMKTFNEFVKHKELVESINETNTSGYNSEDLALMVEQHEQGEWSDEMTGDQLIEWLDNAIAEETNARAK